MAYVGNNYTFKPPKKERSWYGLTKKRGRGGSMVKGATAGAALGSFIPGVGTALGAGLGAAGGLLFGGEAEEEKMARLREEHYQRLLEQQAAQLQGQAAGVLSPADVAYERNVLGQAGRLGQELGQQAGASMGRRGLAFSPLAAQAGMQLQQGIGQSALETLQQQRAARQTTASAQLQNILGTLYGGAQAEVTQQQQLQLEFDQTLASIVSLAMLDPELRALLEGLNIGGGTLPGMDLAERGREPVEVGGVLF